MTTWAVNTKTFTFWTNNMKYYILFGPPGAGKGTHSGAISEKYNLKHISTGELLRAEIAAGTELGQKAKSLIVTGCSFSERSSVLSRGAGLEMLSFTGNIVKPSEYPFLLKDERSESSMITIAGNTGKNLK